MEHKKISSGLIYLCLRSFNVPYYITNENTSTTTVITEHLYDPSGTVQLASVELHDPPPLCTIPNTPGAGLRLLSTQRVCIFVGSEQQSKAAFASFPRLSICEQILANDIPALAICNSRASILSKSIKI